MTTPPDRPQDLPQGGYPPPPPPPGGGVPLAKPGQGPTGGPPPGYGSSPAPGGYGAAGGQGWQGGQGGQGWQGGHGGYGPGGGPTGPDGPGHGQRPGSPPAAYGPGAPLSPDNQRTWAIVSHLSGIFVSFIGPLVVWLVFRGRGAYLEDQAKEALNFQITLVIAYVVGTILSIVGIGLVLIFLAWLATIVFGILAAVASSRGEPYRYPINIRMVS